MASTKTWRAIENFGIHAGRGEPSILLATRLKLTRDIAPSTKEKDPMRRARTHAWIQPGSIILVAPILASCTPLRNFASENIRST
ncbi:MAG TPA: hypothetical protein ENG65_03820 [Candidatus Bathyarchaeota archaeon]|nr:hypothetical protein [Candidatus Bathyarchaeota archaeon]